MVLYFNIHRLSVIIHFNDLSMWLTHTSQATITCTYNCLSSHITCIETINSACCMQYMLHRLQSLYSGQVELLCRSYMTASIIIVMGNQGHIEMFCFLSHSHIKIYASRCLGNLIFACKIGRSSLSFNYRGDEKDVLAMIKYWLRYLQMPWMLCRDST